MCISDVNMPKLPCMSRITLYFLPFFAGGRSDGLLNAIMRHYYPGDSLFSRMSGTDGKDMSVGGCKCMK